MSELVKRVQDLQEYGNQAVQTYLKEVRRNQPIESITETDTHVIIETESFIGKHERRNTDEPTTEAKEKGVYELKTNQLNITFACRTLPKTLDTDTDT